MQRKPIRPPRAPASLPDLYPLEVPRTEPSPRTFFRELDNTEALFAGRAHALVWSWCRGKAEPAPFDAAEARALLRELADASLPRDVDRALGRVARQLAKKRLDPMDLALACVEVGDCAVARGARQSALLWSETAAAVVPWNPRFAWLAGKLHRKWDNCRQAEYWLNRAERAAVRVNDRYTQTLALNSLGNLFRQTGNFIRAKDLLVRALKRARRSRLRNLEGEILHDLSLLSTFMGRFREAEAYGADAFNRYGPTHPNTAKLAHDLALMWADQGFFQRAMLVFTSLLPHFKSSDERMRVLAELVRCAGALGQREAFDRYWAEAWETAHVPQTEPVLASTLVAMGKGAASLAEWDRAADALRWAMTRAEQSGEGDMLAAADAALGGVRLHGNVDVAPRHVKENASSDRLAHILKAGLEEARGQA